MDKIYALLKVLKNQSQLSQREIAKACGFSLGMVNTLLKNMEEQGLILFVQKGSRTEYQLSDSGMECLENLLRERHMDRLNLTQKTKVHTAVILAAGANRDFEEPIALLKIDETSLIERAIQLLLQNQIMKIVVVVGYAKKQLIAVLDKYKEVVVVENPRYKWTGTMASLACAKDEVKEDFLLLESDHLFERNVISALLTHESPSVMFINQPRDSGDEAYVELDQQKHIYRISKDIHELNHIDGECSGVHKVSYFIYKKMLSMFDENKNPYINYEYVLENIGRLYAIDTCMLDDCICMDIDDQKQYEKVKNIYYPKLLKKEKDQDLEALKQLFLKCSGVDESELQKIEPAGGMTNSNFYVKTSKQRYILRIPGKCTETMISRENEKVNGKLGYLLGLNVDTVYFDENSGVKISVYIPNAQTMTGSTARLEKNMKKTARLLSKLHQSEFELKGRFNVFDEFVKYLNIMKENHVQPYSRFDEAVLAMDELKLEMERLGWNLQPCHCDLVAENFIKDEEGRMYLIDWEYAGSNDPMWDLASHFIECGFSESEEELFESYYRDEPLSKVELRKIELFKITQDFLWSAWTMAKEAQGESFGTYGVDRLNRGLALLKKFRGECDE